jgi:protoheme IX farnesyltransferase
MRKNRDFRGIFAAYTDLIKFKLSLAVTFSSVTGYFIFQNGIDISILFLIPGVFLFASGSAVLNQYSETSFDALMGRTKQRPLPQKKVSRNSALLLSLGLFCIGMILLSLTGLIPLLLGVFTVFLYNVIYTRLKRVTPLAIIPGALVGAVPPLIGFVAAGGVVPGAEIILFSVFMFIWQLPHFWLILLKYHKEYETAGFFTLSRLMNEKQIRILVFLWVLLSTSLLVLFSATGIVFNRYLGAILIPVNIIFIFAFYYLLFRKSEKEEFRGAFILVNSFSLLVMILFIVNSFLS